ncbi:hypothetical protein B0A77_00520 [Flavobacterium branchiophilum]|uniref:Uncharacterized protein n=1 Tax=Flavobacterium branchiophilum TaxID=55197 RepID=A0A2H3KV76_9FLAO|nr:hypothetical protein B0A77_00520 [Flavobacterium branchiophilum]
MNHQPLTTNLFCKDGLNNNFTGIVPGEALSNIVLLELKAFTLKCIETITSFSMNLKKRKSS